MATGPAVLLLRLWFERPGWGRGLARVCCFSAAFLVPPTIAVLSLSACAMPVRQALMGTLGTWVAALRPEIVNLHFYRWGLGIDFPWKNTWAMFTMTGPYALVLVPAGLLGLLLRRPGRYRMAIAAGVFLAETLFLWIAKDWTDVRALARPLPLLIATTIVVRRPALPRPAEEAARQRFLPAILAVDLCDGLDRGR